MAKFEVRVLSLQSTSEDSEAPAFEATGTIDGTEFLARTILWGPKGAKEPIFKVVEGEHVAQALKSSAFTRGQRIAIARACKMVRIGKTTVAEAPAGASSEEEGKALDEMTLKELRARAKELGVAGVNRKGITKAEVVELVAAAA